MLLLLLLLLFNATFTTSKRQHDTKEHVNNAARRRGKSRPRPRHAQCISRQSGNSAATPERAPPPRRAADRGLRFRRFVAAPLTLVSTSTRRHNRAETPSCKTRRASFQSEIALWFTKTQGGAGVSQSRPASFFTSPSQQPPGGARSSVIARPASLLLQDMAFLTVFALSITAVLWFFARASSRMPFFPQTNSLYRIRWTLVFVFSVAAAVVRRVSTRATGVIIKTEIQRDREQNLTRTGV